MSKRNPYPIPRVENDHSFTGKPPQYEEPWSRLAATSSSAQRSATLHKPEASNGLHLKSVNNEDLVGTRSQTVYKRETVSEDHGTPKNHETQKVLQEPLKKNSIRMWIDPQKCSIHSIKGTIESDHNSSTNGGYSRKPDGGFYST
ncbi:hypothetical protein NHX12_013200 [Muraenolepis orangiensis]|uniref:Uncharacterized protein n=1 Tax=Muraenolepis orangiensis TaxID=630683 RepID=A0A9Q0DE70_9TELE|nr:hypothetical protein NHX12_013200 [Muraenolepis orangiensis]